MIPTTFRRLRCSSFYPAFVALAVLPGCVAPVEEGSFEAQGESEPAQEDGLVDKAQDWFAGAWNDSAPVSAETHLCFLGGVKGYFNEEADVKLELQGGVTGDWRVFRNAFTSSSHQGHSVCTKWSNFIRPSGSTRTIVVGTSVSRTEESDITDSRQLHNGSFAAALREVGGHLNGGGEFVEITQGTNATNTTSRLKLHSEAGSLFDPARIAGAALSIQNNPDHQDVTLVGYAPDGTKTRGTVRSSGTFEFTVATDSGFSGFFTANTSGAASGICYLTRVSGNFDGTPESASISENSGTWFLKVARGGSGRYVRARARCMAYDQRAP